MAKFFINNVTKALPVTVTMLESKRHTGNKLYSIWYGYYDCATSFYDRLKLYIRNGKT
tara:strand:+ start:317 stop:490 length:174 start_codon:yes stop_codon:yes gene_type:complete